MMWVTGIVGALMLVAGFCVGLSVGLNRADEFLDKLDDWYFGDWEALDDDIS